MGMGNPKKEAAHGQPIFFSLGGSTASTEKKRNTRFIT
jgi:hypothetical protein